LISSLFWIKYQKNSYLENVEFVFSQKLVFLIGGLPDKSEFSRNLAVIVDNKNEFSRNLAVIVDNKNEFSRNLAVTVLDKIEFS
jgi:hypothetical protein